MNREVGTTKQKPRRIKIERKWKKMREKGKGKKKRFDDLQSIYEVIMCMFVCV